MGLVLPQNVNVRIVSNNAIYYRNLGYELPLLPNGKINTKGSITVDVNDLPKNSGVIVDVNCNYCQKKLKVRYAQYMRCKSENGNYYCHDCCFNNPEWLKKQENNKIKNRAMLINELTEYIKNNGFPVNVRKEFKRSNGLHSSRMYFEYLGDTLLDWIIACGFNLTEEEKYSINLSNQKINYTKDEVINIIKSMQAKLDRPLKYDDFDNPTLNTISVTYIKKYFGSLNKMKQELGLIINKENMSDKKPTKEDLENMIIKLADYMQSINRNTFTEREYKQIANKLNIRLYSCMNRWCHKYFNLSFADKIKEYGLSLGNPGKGIVTTIGEEKCMSQFEYMFSSFLHSQGLIYNEDYYRNVKYKTFIKDYTGNMDCDYLLNINNTVIYIEIAGILEEYKQWYYQNKPIISSKSKEIYRMKLLKKENMLKQNNLVYFILFPCDLTKDNFNNILSNPSNELREKIEQEYKTNIDWTIIQKIGELKYLDIKGRNNQKLVDYSFNDKKEVALDA